MRIRLEKISGNNFRDILALRVGEGQEDFVAPNSDSLVEAYLALAYRGQAFPFGIYDGDTPVGFCMVGYGKDDDWEDAPAIAEGNYNLWRFMIDRRYQGKGYGRAAMERVMAFIAGEPCGPAEYCWLSYEPGNDAARRLYASFGFRETGETDGDEVIAALALAHPPARTGQAAEADRAPRFSSDWSRKISERQWNLPDKGELESRRESTYIDDIIQKDHIQRKLLENLDGVQTVFDGGAGSGRFSILLAKQGCRVTHFDISRPMIDKARELAEKEGVSDRITFVKGALEDLGAYGDRAFDLVLSVDAPVSYTWPNQEKVIGELVRIAGKKILLSVSGRLGSLPYLANPVQKNQFILDEQADDPFVQWCVANRERMIEGFSFSREAAEKLLSDGLMGGEEEIAQYERGGAPWCITYTFLPDELASILAGYGVRNIRLSGPGAYGRTIPREILVRIMNDPRQRKDFLDFCYRYDSNLYVCGMGKDNLVAVGDV